MTKLSTARKKKTPLRGKSVRRTGNLETRRNQKKALEKEIDTLWSQIQHRRWGKVCAWPGCQVTEGLHPHHWEHKAQGNVARWHLLNSILLCPEHHNGEVHTKSNTEPARLALVTKIGHEAFYEMLKETKKVWKPTIEELLKLKEGFKGILG